MPVQYKRSITIDGSKVVGSTQTNFPVLITFTHNELRTPAFGGYVRSPLGHDIQFFADPFLTIKLDWELELYVASTGQVVAWVRVPTLLTGAPTTIYIGYGDPSISTFQGNVLGTWSNGFGELWHYGTTGSLNINGVKGLTGVNNGGVAAGTGQISGAANFAGSNRYLTYGDNLDPLNGSYSVTLLVNHASQAAQNFPGIIGKGDSVGAPHWGINVHSGGADANKIYFEFSDGTNNASAISSIVPSLNAWHHIALNIDRGTNLATLYIDGANAVSSSIAIVGSVNSGIALAIGSRNAFATFGNFYTGRTDETRISQVSRSSDWYATESNNLLNPSTFFALGAQQLNVKPGQSGLHSGGALVPAGLRTGGRL